MKLTAKQKILAGIAGFLLILIITNPSAQAFKEYIGSNSYNGLSRDKNFFIASIYEYDGNRYIALIGNFIKEDKKHQPISTRYNDGNEKMSADSALAKTDTVSDPFKEFGGHKTTN